MNLEQQLERVRMCIAEAGHDPKLVHGKYGHLARYAGTGADIPLFVWWRALALVGATRVCWPCKRAVGEIWDDDPRFGIHHGEPCGHPVNPFCPEDAEVSA